MKKLRDYQVEDVQSIFEQFKENTSTLYVAATGLGKTRVMVDVARRFLPNRTILLAHRNELIIQARNTFIEHGLAVEVEKADLFAGTICPCGSALIATVQTLLAPNGEVRRMERFNPMDFGLLLYDEVHHSVSEGNRKIIEYFTKGNADLRVLGVTATPDRADEEALGQLFQTVACERDILWANENGWLVPIAQRMIHVNGLDFSEIKTTCGDLNSGELATVMESESCVQGVVQPTIESLFDLEPNSLTTIPVALWPEVLQQRQPIHRAIVFTVTVAQAKMLSDIFNRVIPGLAQWICGKTRADERAETLKRFAHDGDIKILVNVGVTTEGYDNPAVDMVVMARPTKSRSLYAQMIGRGTRPVTGLVDSFEGADQRIDAISKSSKPFLTVLDFVGNAGKHKLMTTADILGGNVSDQAVERAIKKAKGSARAIMMTEALLEAEEELRREQEQRRLAEEARKARLVAKVSYVSRSVNPFDVLSIEPSRERGWDQGKILTEKQRDVLLKQGVNPDGLTYHEQKQLLVEIFRRFGGQLCSFKQAKILKNNGIDPKEVSRVKASQLIDKIASNNWRRPPDNIIQEVLTS